MLILSNSLSQGQWDSLYTNRIAAPLTSKLRLQESQLITIRPASNIDSRNKVGVGGGSKVEFVGVENYNG